MARAQRVETFGDAQWVVSMTGHGTSTMNPNGVLGFELVRVLLSFSGNAFSSEGWVPSLGCITL
jgi:hypothetical protein